MMPVKSISLLSGFNLQDESLIPFEQVVLDSSLAVNRYSVSSDNAKYNNLFAGDLEDEDLYLEVSYKDKTTGNYVPRKFDFSNYLRYVENALSILNNGIMGVYLTKAQADELYVKINGDTMYGPLAILLDNTSDTTAAPLKITDNRSSVLGDNNGAIQINGVNHSLIILYNEAIVGAKIDGKPSSLGHALYANGVFDATTDSVQISQNLIATANVTTPHIEDIAGPTGNLTLAKTVVNSVLTSNNGILIHENDANPHGLTVENGNIEISNGELNSPRITAGIGVINTSLTMAGILTADSSAILLDQSLSANNGILAKHLHVYDETQSNKSILVATKDSIEFNRSVNSNAAFTSTAGGITINSGSDLTLNGGNVVMGETGQIKFDTKYIKYNNTAGINAFEITDLYISNKLIAGKAETSGTPKNEVSPTSAYPTTGTLVVRGDIICATGSIFSNTAAIKADKIVTPNFESGEIKATVKFVQETGIAELTAKRACWA